jgi:chromodomain-helicase-DNA-binding protein 4
MRPLNILLLYNFLPYPRFVSHPRHDPKAVQTLSLPLLTTLKLLEDDLFGYEGAKTALMAFYNPPRKRKRHHDEWDSDLGSEPDSADLENDIDDDEDDLQSSEGPPKRTLRSLRSREPSAKRLSQTPASPSNNEDDKMDIDTSPPPSKRVLRTRQPQRAPYMDDKDELAEEPSRSGDDDDAKYLPVVRSDVVLPKGRPRIRRLQSSRLSRSSGKSLSRPQRQNSSDSDIEFEAPRRSGRATRNRVDMRDDANMDEESFYIDEERPAGVPKVISIREVFEPISPDSPFASVHMDTCHTCGGGRQRGQLIHCQGCSLSYHKNCLGYRSAREHMVTKVGEGDFVLQCRLCINIYRKKDKMAPRFDMCQDCKEPGKSCAAFSAKKTARQEEKLREENDGTDPITPVDKGLINNPSHPLFRCVRCHRGWHIEHLPPAGRSPDQAGSDLRMERLKDYSVDWECTECSLAEQKIHRLVAWRPTEEQVGVVPATAVEDDKKEYLIKWENKSYFHCEWKPGAWVYGVSAATMRNAFYKRDLEQGLMKLSRKDAIPDEFLMADVVLNVKMDSSAPRSRTKHEQFENIGHVRKILVKFQGLGYDDVVWDTPPRESAGKDIWNAFLEAYFDYLEGKYFHSEPQSKIRERVKAYKSAGFEEVEEQPAGLKRGKLMAYQVEGLNWMLRNYHGGRSVVLADEMGLGKTVQVVALVTSLTQDDPKVRRVFLVMREFRN